MVPDREAAGLCRSTTPLHPVLHQDGIDQARTHVVSGDPVVPRHRELFYFLALGHKAVQVNPKTSFEDYRGELSKVIPNLSGRPGMERLNRVRVNLKHHGSIPGIQQVADARTDVEVFLAANTQAVFGVDYDTVTMATWCHTNGSNQARYELLRRWRRPQQAMGLLAEAFGELFNPHYRAYIEPLPLSFGTTLTWPTRLRDGEAAAVLTWLRGDSKRGGHRNPRGLADQIEAITDVATAAQAALRVMTMGVEYFRYLRLSG